MMDIEFGLVRAAGNILAVDGKQKGQKGQKVAKISFLLLFALFALFASRAALEAYAQDGGAQQSGAGDKQAASQNEEENVPSDRITIHQLKRMMDAKEEVVIVDTRAGGSYVGSVVKIKGAIHITLVELEDKMKELPKNKLIVTYCT